MKFDNPLTDSQLSQIEKDFFQGLAGDHEMRRLIDAVRMQRAVLKTLFTYFTREPMRRFYTAEPVRVSELAYLKERVAMEDCAR